MLQEVVPHTSRVKYIFGKVSSIYSPDMNCVLTGVHTRNGKCLENSKSALDGNTCGCWRFVLIPGIHPVLSKLQHEFTIITCKNQVCKQKLYHSYAGKILDMQRKSNQNNKTETIVHKQFHQSTHTTNAEFKRWRHTKRVGPPEF